MFITKFAITIVSFHVILTHSVEACIVVPATPEQESNVIDTINEIGRKLSYAQWENDPTSNVILCPLNIATALNLIMLGTNGTTYSEIREAINYANDLEECTIHNIYRNLFISLQQQSGNETEISLNTKLFLQVEFPILDSFVNISNLYYFGDVQSLDFKNFPSNSTDTINEWVSSSTNGKIEKLFQEPLKPTTVFVIVNVILFNATWENIFPPGLTKNGTFEAETGNITIPMMNKEMTVPYLNDFSEGLEIIALPYAGNRFSMFILKPTDNSSVNRLKEIENHLIPSELDSLINRMEPTTVKVKIPRMKLDLDLDLIKDLKKTFGINEIFYDSADFTRISPEPRIFISKIIHRAFLEICEEGTIAGAATGLVGEVTGSLSPPPPKFKLNKPSMVLIRDNNTKSVILNARVMEPEPIW